ncbi:uracil-DNA glycosylase family protein [uncultured Lentibacter sp.]|jgi:uracil-DNA glycosylase|uniref:uracil-DNA glycosylase family protein n=1 Tax=uncultured Lentibacter sp. TaxID=1659309 RepID=UPI0026286489|nr:uracil-DNA glycosylase family protein [uncultured Lentibacter sp.]
MSGLVQKIHSCRLCAARFAATATAHCPRPVPWFDARAKVLLAGQAPGARVHASGRPFDDPSGERLRRWLALSPEAFYDRAKIAIVPMAFCFPGYDSHGRDLAPPPICAQTWHSDVMQSLPALKLRIVIGGAAQRYHLGARGTVTETTRRWRDHAPQVFPLPHPSWRNTGWIKKNPWFEAELLPELRAALKEALP